MNLELKTINIIVEIDSKGKPLVTQRINVSEKLIEGVRERAIREYGLRGFKNKIMPTLRNIAKEIANDIYGSRYEKIVIE